MAPTYYASEGYLMDVITGARFVEMSRAISKAEQISPNMISVADNLRGLAGQFGITIPYTFTYTELAYINYCQKAIVQMALMLQNIMRFHRAGPRCYKEVMRCIEVPSHWERKTVYAIHHSLEEIAKKYNLNRQNIPEGNSFRLNDFEKDTFIRVALLCRSNYCVFYLTGLDGFCDTNLLTAKQVSALQGKNLGKSIQCFKISTLMDIFRKDYAGKMTVADMFKTNYQTPGNIMAVV